MSGMQIFVLCLHRDATINNGYQVSVCDEVEHVSAHRSVDTTE